jgi:hypothetical protein
MLYLVLEEVWNDIDCIMLNAIPIHDAKNYFLDIHNLNPELYSFIYKLSKKYKIVEVEDNELEILTRGKISLKNYNTKEIEYDNLIKLGILTKKEIIDIYNKIHEFRTLRFGYPDDYNKILKELEKLDI